MTQADNFLLENLPLDPAQEAGKGSLLREQKRDDPNRPETERDGIRSEALRRLQVRRMFQGPQGQTQA